MYPQSSKPRDGVEKGEGALHLTLPHLFCTKYSQSQKGDRNEVLINYKPYAISWFGTLHSPAHILKKNRLFLHIVHWTLPCQQMHWSIQKATQPSKENAGYQESCTGKCVRQHLPPQQNMNQKQNCRKTTTQPYTRLAPSEYYSVIPYPQPEGFWGMTARR